MDFSEILTTLQAAIPALILALLLWFYIDTYLLIRYGGKLNRGLTIWRRQLSSNEKRFLTNLDHDIVKIEELGWLVKRKRKSFIALANGEALIRYSQTSWNTSWPVVFYVDLTASRPEFEFRMSFPGLLLWLALASVPVHALFSKGQIIGLFLLAFFIAMLGISTIVEITACKEFLARQVEFSLIRTTSQAETL